MHRIEDQVQEELPYHCTPTIESLTQASVFSLPQLVSSLLDSVAEAQRIQVSTRQAAVKSSQPMHSQDCLNVST